MIDEARELYRIISASVRDMLDVYRIQAQPGPVTAEALEEIIFRAVHPIMAQLAPYPVVARAGLLPHVVHALLVSFLEAVAGAEGIEEGTGARVTDHATITGPGAMSTAHGRPIKAPLPVSGWPRRGGRRASVKSTCPPSGTARPPRGPHTPLSMT